MDIDGATAYPYHGMAGSYLLSNNLMNFTCFRLQDMHFLWNLYG